MITWGTALSPQHVEALNEIPVEFHGDSEKIRQINDNWNQYINHLLSDFESPSWPEKRVELFNNMLLSMSNFLGYKFGKADFAKFYLPIEHFELEQDMKIIRKNLARLLQGHGALRVHWSDHSQNEPLQSQRTDSQY